MRQRTMIKMKHRHLERPMNSIPKVLTRYAPTYKDYNIIPRHLLYQNDCATKSTGTSYAPTYKE